MGWESCGLFVGSLWGAGVNVPITPVGIDDILGTTKHIDPLVLTELNIRPPNQAIRHTLCGPQSMVKWTKQSGKRYHQSLSYAHIFREGRVWLKIVMNFLIPGLHYKDITRDRIFLDYAMMTATELNIGVVLKSAMRKAKLGDVERSYPLNAHDKALHGIGLEFRVLVDNGIPIAEDLLRTSSVWSPTRMMR
ncbi:hypothetical protein H5410_036733 [Solanum commersonii]|uniref:Putative plant transposon protein domain-containing protein n=1 Tax=Solanum commersonii TaxID=4109 RepID=A0A9J5Y5P5_SOLCO|nr:hypothetical protein H5410_036733 [Solanum commersonii]